MRNLLLTVLILMIAGCQMPQRQQGTPSKMPDGKWVSFSWYSSQGGGIRANLDYSLGSAFERASQLNSNAYKHERYMSTIKIPALDQKAWQDNAKAMSYWIGKYGRLP